VDFLHASVTGLVQVFAWPTFRLMLLGMALGFVVGLLPGLGGPTTLALTLPFVFKMTPIEAFAFLLLRAGLFPWAITTAALILALVHATRDFTRRRGAAADPKTLGAGAAPDSTGEGRRTAAICGWILGMYAAIWLLGFSLATLVTTVLYLRVARERWPISLGLSLAAFAFVYGLFEKALSVPFPTGQLFVWLGYGG
jgi:hypothetical protein